MKNVKALVDSVVDMPASQPASQAPLKYYVWYCSDNGVYPNGFSILLFYTEIEEDPAELALRGDMMNPGPNLFNFEGKITEDDDTFYEPAVKKLLRSMVSQPTDWTDVQKGSALHQDLVKAAHEEYPIDEYDGWPLYLSNTGKIKELLPSVAERFLSLI